MGIAATFGELGPGNFLSYAAVRLSAVVPGVAWHRYRLIAVPIERMPAMPRGHEAREMTAVEIAANRDALELPEAAIAHRLGQGMTCLGVWRGDRLLGVNWVTDRAFLEDEVAVRFVPPPNCGWDTGLYVRPEDRGGRAFAALWAASADWLRARGLSWSLSRITDYNLASWRSHRRMGGQPLGALSILTLAGRDLVLGKNVTHPAGAPATLTLPSPA